MNSSLQAYVFEHSHKLVVLFTKVMEPLGDEFLLEEVHPGARM